MGRNQELVLRLIAGTSYARSAVVKNISFTVESKNGAFVTSRVSGMHHSAESRIGLIEVGIACVVLAVLVGFALVVVA